MKFGDVIRLAHLPTDLFMLVCPISDDGFWKVIGISPDSEWIDDTYVADITEAVSKPYLTGVR